jgi:hypothetical protein
MECIGANNNRSDIMINLITKEELIDKSPSASYERAVEITQGTILKNINTYLLFLLTEHPQVLEDFDGAVVLKIHRVEKNRAAHNINTVACERALKKILEAGYNAKYEVKRAKTNAGMIYEDRITIYWKDAANKIYNMI